MKKFILLFTMIMMVLVLAACGDNEAKNDAKAPGVITDLEMSEVSEPQYINPLEFDADETVESLYYKRTANDAGESMYMVERADDGEPVYMPVTETVIYTSNEDAGYYQEITLTYKQDGEPMEKKQYQIYVSVPDDENENSEAGQIATDDTDNNTLKVLPGNDQETPDKVNKAVI